jgi:cell shape-determining protein MreC
MNYRLDKKNRNKKIKKALIIVLVIFIIFLFRIGIFNGLSYTASTVFRPILVLGNNLGNKFSSIGSGFVFKRILVNENQSLKTQLNDTIAKEANYNTILDENLKLKEILGRKNVNANMVLGNILSKKNESIYSSLIIDVGVNQGAIIGQRVFGLGNIPIGRIGEVEPNSSKVILYSSPRESTEVIISGKNIFMQAVGRGGGNFEMTLPRDFVLEVGTEVSLPGLTPYVLGTVSTIISDPRDAFQKALLVSPVNIQELKFVQVEI